MFEGLTEKEIITRIRALSGDEVSDIMEEYGYVWDENESESRNERLFAEYMISYFERE